MQCAKYHLIDRTRFIYDSGQGHGDYGSVTKSKFSYKFHIFGASFNFNIDDITVIENCILDC